MSTIFVVFILPMYRVCPPYAAATAAGAAAVAAVDATDVCVAASAAAYGLPLCDRTTVCFVYF